jgi:hypothetical protein
MKKIFLLIIISIFSLACFAQIANLSLTKRVELANTIVIGKVLNSHSYWNEAHTNIYTLHEIEIMSYLKGHSNNSKIAMIDLGGIVDNEAQETCPSVHLQNGEIQILMLDKNEVINADKEYKLINGNIQQCTPTASIQGVISFSNNAWHDIANPTKEYTTIEIVDAIKSITKEEVKTPDNKKFIASSITGTTAKKTRAIVNLTTAGGTISSVFQSGIKNDASREMIINGTGFGTTPGTILFPDADNGGSSTFVFPTTTVSSFTRYGRLNDVLSWTNTQIRIRIPRNAGTGTMTVLNTAGTSVGTSPITIEWAEIPVYSNFSGFGTDTSGQRVEQANRNLLGGYTFQYSTGGTTSFFADAAAKSAFERAITTWRCGTKINWDVNRTTGNAAVFAGDNISIVMYDNTLPAGVLGRCSGRFLSTSNAGCTLYNTLWYVREMDVQIISNASSTLTGIPASWNYGSSATPFTQFSFESVLLHELGHGHGMGHVIDATKVMNFNISNGQDKNTLATSDIDAGIYKVAHSVTPYCITSISPMVALSASVACSPLPITLLSFNGYATEATNILEWENSEEINVSHFEILKSADGHQFTSIAKINPSASMKYSVVDEKPNAGNNFYKLKTVDIDGQYTYSSNVVYIYRTDDFSFTIAPNPTKEKVVIDTKNNTLKYEFILTNATGVVICRKKNVIGTKTIELKNQAKGIYFLNIIANNKQHIQKVVVE